MDETGMPTSDAAPARTASRRRGGLSWLLSGLVVVTGLWAWSVGPAWLAWWSYRPQEGDVLFQSLPHSPLVDAIEGVSGSPFSHCGIVGLENGEWVVYEAYRRVETTPLRTFLFRGRNQAFAVYRLKAEARPFIPSTLVAAKAFLGRPYDVRYRLDDERIYCSELIFKAYRNASSGELLGKLERLGDMNWQPYEATIEHFEEGPVPLEREIITPKELARASQLELVTAHRMDVEP